MYTDFKINIFNKGEGSRRCEDKRPKTDTYARAQTYFPGVLFIESI